MKKLRFHYYIATRPCCPAISCQDVTQSYLLHIIMKLRWTYYNQMAWSKSTRDSGWKFYIQLTGERPHSYGPFFASLEHSLPVTRKKANVKNRLFILLTVIHLPSTFENLLGWRLGWRSASLSLHQSLGLRRH